MTDETAQALVPTDVRDIDFYGNQITAALVYIDDEARIYVLLRQLSEHMGLSWAGQRERTMRDEVLAEVVRFVRVTRTNSAGGNPNALALPLEFVPGWLFGISTQRVKPEIREQIIQYRREVYQRIWDSFKHEILGTRPIQTPATLTPAEQAYETAMALANLAREQMEFERKTESRFASAARWAKGIEERVNAMEVRLTTLTDAEANEIQLGVKNVAYELEQRGTVNGHQRVYGEMYRRFGVSSYKAISSEDYQQVRNWLHQWYEEIIKSPSTP